jgi:plastocyanin
MKRILLLTGAALLLCNCSSDPVNTGVQEPAVVSMPGFTFSPFTTTIKVGKGVQFDFPSEAHNVIFEKKTGVPSDIQVVLNTKVTRTFNTVGTFPYDCTIHPGMSGQVIVTQ